MSGAHDHLLRALWRKNGHIYRTVSIIYDPAVTIEDIVTGKRETHVVGSLNYEQIERLLPENQPIAEHFVDPFEPGVQTFSKDQTKR